MTWQRIDENTYIDDTLVTCAEYQLFIDEMREQGKYYQPDHWLSFQFPKGMAKEPVLGVRHSDAAAFCEWLTWQELSGWDFRLPEIVEAEEFSINLDPQRLSGYWITNAISPNFFMIGDVSKNTQIIQREFANTLEIAFQHSSASETARVAARELEFEFEIALDLDLTKEMSHNLKSELTTFFANEQNMIMPNLPTQELIISLDSLGLRNNRGTPKTGIDFSVEIIRNLDNERENVVERGKYKLAQFLDINLIQTLEIFVHLYTLQERIAGRSPAFEGIRLVKERIV